MNNIRTDRSHHWINQDELTKQIDRLSTKAKEDRDGKVLETFVRRGEEMKQRVRSGEDISDTVAEEVLRKRINDTFPSENHEDRWARKNKAALEIRGINEKIKNLGTAYRQGRLNDSTYWQRIERLGVKKLELEREL